MLWNQTRLRTWSSIIIKIKLQIIFQYFNLKFLLCGFYLTIGNMLTIRCKHQLSLLCLVQSGIQVGMFFDKVLMKVEWHLDRVLASIHLTLDQRFRCGRVDVWLLKNFHFLRNRCGRICFMLFVRMLLPLLWFGWLDFFRWNGHGLGWNYILVLVTWWIAGYRRMSVTKRSLWKNTWEVRLDCDILWNDCILILICHLSRIDWRHLNRCIDVIGKLTETKWTHRRKWCFSVSVHSKSGQNSGTTSSNLRNRRFRWWIWGPLNSAHIAGGGWRGDWRTTIGKYDRISIRKDLNLTRPARIWNLMGKLKSRRKGSIVLVGDKWVIFVRSFPL